MTVPARTRPAPRVSRAPADSLCCCCRATFQCWGIDRICHLLLNAKQSHNLFTLITEFYSAKIPTLKCGCKSYANHRTSTATSSPASGVSSMPCSSTAPCCGSTCSPRTPHVQPPWPLQMTLWYPVRSHQEVCQGVGQVLPLHLRRDEFHPAKASSPRHG